MPTVKPKRSQLSADALETSQLVVEFLHVLHAAQGPTAARQARDAAGHDRAAMSPHAVRAAIHLYQHGQRTISELAAGLGVSMGWASRVVRELEEADLVVRSQDPEDRRVVRVSMSTSAMPMVESAYRWRGEAIERALQGLDAKGRAAVATFLRQAIEEFSRLDG